MYRSHEQEWASGSAALRVPAPAAPALARPGCRARKLVAVPGIAAWTVDLAEGIGTRRWYHGLATLAGLVLFALAFWPDFSRLEAAPAVRGQAIVPEQWNALAVRPLAYDATPAQPRSAAVRPVAAVPERPSVTLQPVLSKGDSLAAALTRAGAAAADAAQAAALVNAQLPSAGLPGATRMALVLGPRSAPGQPRRLDRVELRATFDLALAVTRTGGGLQLERKPIAVDVTPLRIRGTVGQSLYRSARAAGAPPRAIQEYLQALDGHLSLDGDVQPDDAFDLVFASRRAATGETETGELLYAGLERGKQPVAQLVRWGREGGFYSADAFSRPRYVETAYGGGGGGMLMPVNGRVTSLYGQRFHPILGYARMHAGVDFGAAWGSPIVATADGIVAFAGYHGGHGNYVRVEHGGGLGTGYGHMSRIAVAPGERVRAGEVIGYVGSTGLSTGPHLHYEMYRDGRTVNPLSAAPMRVAVITRQVDSGQLSAFRARLAQLRAIRPGVLAAAAMDRAVQAGRRIALR